MIDFFMSLVTPSSKGLDNLPPRAAPLGFCEVLQTVWACISGLISTAKRSSSYSSPELASRWCAWGLVPQWVWLKRVLPFDMCWKCPILAQHSFMPFVVLSLRPVFCSFDISLSLFIPDINWSAHLLQYARLLLCLASPIQAVTYFFCQNFFPKP